MGADIPDKNLFMICARLNRAALSGLSKEYHARNCGEHELDIWKAMPFDTTGMAEKHRNFMTRYFNAVYESKRAEFFKRCKFITNKNDEPIGTCFIWKANNKINTIHWFKVIKKYEGRGIGRALLSIIMENTAEEDYPVYLHTQPGSYRAIKLYSDFGFKLIRGPVIGNRKNDLEECLPLLRHLMPEEFFNKLETVPPPADFLAALGGAAADEF